MNTPRTCLSCGITNKDDAKFCKSCGELLRPYRIKFCDFKENEIKETLNCTYDEIKVTWYIHIPSDLNLLVPEFGRIEECQELIIKQLIYYRQGDKWGFCDSNSKEKTQCIYDEIMILEDDIIPVRIGNYWGFINHMGKEVAPCTYSNIKPYYPSHSNIHVFKNGKWGLIDKSGKEILPCIYDDTKYNIDICTPICIKGKWGLIGPLKNEIIPCEYDDIQSGHDGTVLALKYGFAFTYNLYD